MTEIEIVKRLPGFHWSELAELEMNEQGLELIQQTDVIYKVGSVAVAGFMWRSFFQPPWLWFALSRDAKFRDLIDFRRLAEQIPAGTLTAVRDDKPVAKRFAEFYGFVPTLQFHSTPFAVYQLFRKER